MDIKGEERIPVPIQTVWEGLNSTDILLQAIPGCESIERTNLRKLLCILNAYFIANFSSHWNCSIN